MSNAVEVWDRFLTDFELHLEGQRLAFSEERFDEIDAMLPPDALPAMPEQFAPRLAAVLQDSLELEDAVARRLEDIARELTTVQRSTNRRPDDGARRGLLDTRV